MTEPVHASVVVLPNDWPIAVKITILCTAIAIALAAALTSIGYYQAAAGLAVQADKEIEADAHIVETMIDDWHQQRLATLALGAVSPAVVRVAESGDQASATDHAQALAVLGSITQRNPDVETVGVMDRRGTYVMDVDPSSLGVSGPQYDFFQQPMAGVEFISGVTISGITNKPALYHAVPIRNAAGTVIGVLRTRSALTTVTGVEMTSAQGQAITSSTSAL